MFTTGIFPIVLQILATGIATTITQYKSVVTKSPLSSVTNNIQQDITHAARGNNPIQRTLSQQCNITPMSQKHEPGMISQQEQFK